MAAKTVQDATVVDGAVARACSEAGVADNSPIRQALVHDAEVYDDLGSPAVCVPDPDGKSVSLRTRLSQMREEPRWRGEFPEKKAANRPVSQVQAPTGGATLQPDRDVFNDIVSGKAVVR